MNGERDAGTSARRDRTARCDRHTTAAATLVRAATWRAQVKILTTAMQMLSLFANDDSYPVSTPPAYSKYVADASGWANLDFYSFFKSVHASRPLRLTLASRGHMGR